MITMELKGIRGVERKLRELAPNVRKKVVRQAVRAGGNIILPKAKENARGMPDWAGGSLGSAMASALAVRAVKRQRSGSYAMTVGYRPNVGEFIYMTADGVRYYVPAAVEFGHAKPGSGGTQRKDVPPRPIIRNAFDARKERAVKEIERRLARGIEQQAARG